MGQSKINYLDLTCTPNKGLCKIVRYRTPHGFRVYKWDIIKHTWIWVGSRQFVRGRYNAPIIRIYYEQRARDLITVSLPWIGPEGECGYEIRFSMIRKPLPSMAYQSCQHILNSYSLHLGWLIGPVRFTSRTDRLFGNCPSKNLRSISGVHIIRIISSFGYTEYFTYI